MNNTYRFSLSLNILLLASLYFFPALSRYNSYFSLLDEMIIIYMLGIVIVRIILQKYIFTTLELLISAFLFYSMFLILYNNLPLQHIMQVFIYSKFIIIYLYFNSYSQKYKYDLFLLIVKTLMIVFVLSFLFTIFQFLFPNIFHGYSLDGRGFFGITAQGIFGSRTFYPAFLVMFAILLFSMKNVFSGIFRFLLRAKYYILTLTLILILLTFARKDLTLFLFLIPILLYDKIENKSKVLVYFLYFGIILMVFFGMLYMMQDLNEATFNDRQVRLYILEYALEVFKFYFPFGSGPGTYGSIMSLEYTNVYEQFSVPENVTGTSERRGPIFDVFIFGLLAEYGIGIFFYIVIVLNMIVQKNNVLISNFFHVRKFKICTMIVIGSVSFFVPILINWIGYMYIVILALITQKGNSFHQLK